MFASPDTDALLESMHELVQRMAEGEEDEELPLIRAGLAYGPVFTRGGDYYGRAVNLASRITETARPGSVLVTTEIRDHTSAEKFGFSRARRKHLKGISGSVELYRCRRNGAGEDDDPD
jgi:adenylate cyclase